LLDDKKIMDPDPGGPKIYRSYESGSSFGSATLHGTFGVSTLITPQGKLLVTYYWNKKMAVNFQT
jgi:hypothetical protein